jgi:hypothetical protein
VQGVKELKPGAGVYTCPKCGAIYTPRGGTIYLGDSYNYVLPYWAPADTPVEQARYYDLTCLGSKGIERRHGWYDTVTRRITQVG